MTQDRGIDGTTRKVGFIFVSALITQGSLLVLYLVLARLLTVEEFATFRQLFLIQSMLNGIFFAALPTCLLYFTGRADSDNEKKAYLRVVVVLTMTIALSLSLTLLFASDNISRLFNNDQLSIVLPYFSLSPLGVLMIALMPACHIVTNRTAIQPYVAASIAVVIALPTMIIALAGVGLIEVVRLISVLYLVVGLVLCTLMFTVYSAGMDFNVNFRLKVKAVCLYSWPLLMASAVSIVGLKADHVIVASVLGTFTYGLYSVGAFEIPVFNMLQNSVTSVLMPQITALLKAHHFEQATKLWQRAAAKTAAVTFPLALLLMINAELVVKALFGVKYVDASIVFVLFNSFVFLRVITFGLALRAMNKTHIELALTLVYLVSSVVGSFYMASYYGIEGAAFWAIVNTVILSLALSLYTLWVSKGKLALWRVYPVRHFLVGLTLFFSVRFMQEINLLSFSHPMMVSVFYSVVVIFVWLVSLRFINFEDTA